MVLHYCTPAPSCTPSPFSRPKDVLGCSAAPEEFAPAASCALLLFLRFPTRARVCVCLIGGGGDTQCSWMSSRRSCR